MKPVFPVDKEKGVLEVLIHRGSIANSSERTISTAKNNVPAAIRLGPITWHDDRHFISRWKVPAAPIAVRVGCELDRNIFTAVFLEYLHGLLEDVNPAVVHEDEILQALHDDRVKCCIALHTMIESLAWAIYIQLCIYRTVSVMWKEGTELVTEFTMDAECWGSPSTVVDAAVYLNSE